MQRLLDGPDPSFECHMMELCTRYKRELRKIIPVFPKCTRDLFLESCLNGAYLSYLQVIQNSVANTKCSFRGKTHRVDIIISLLLKSPDIGCDVNYILKYIDVKRYKIDYPTCSPLHFDESPGLDSWGFDELSKRGKWLLHDILFHSGAEMEITFRTLCVRKRLRRCGGRARRGGGVGGGPSGVQCT